MTGSDDREDLPAPSSGAEESPEPEGSGSGRPAGGEGAGSGEGAAAPAAKASAKAKARAGAPAVPAGAPPALRPREPVSLKRSQDVKASPRSRPAAGEDVGQGAAPAVEDLREGPDGEPLPRLAASPRLRVPAGGPRKPEPLLGEGPPGARGPNREGRGGKGDLDCGGAAPPTGISARARAVTPFMVMEVLERARELEAAGRGIIHMEVGEPDFPTPPFVVEAMRRALDSGGSFGYAHSLGDPELREALSRHYRARYGLGLPPGRFLVCPGTSVGMSLLFGAIIDPGDKVILSDPCYSCYPNFVRFWGGVPVFRPVSEKDGFRFDPDDLKKLLKKERGVKALVVNSPANPTGAVLGPDILKAIAGLGVFVISDEIYHGLNYGEERDHSILEYTDRAAAVGGLSKSWAMTGWRAGHLALPPDLARPLQTLAQNFVISVNSAVQKAAISALDEGWPEVERMRSVYDSRRRILLEGLRRLGLKVLSEPLGAFYMLARADHVSPDSKSLVFDILEEAGVGCVPGREFGSGAEGFLRFSYAVSAEDIQEALARLEGFLRRRGKLP